MNGESNKMHAANSNSTESNLIRVGEASTKWKAASNTDVASRPLEKDSIKASAAEVNIKSSKAGLSPVEEVDLVEKSHSDKIFAKTNTACLTGEKSGDKLLTSGG